MADDSGTPAWSVVTAAWPQQQSAAWDAVDEQQKKELTIEALDAAFAQYAH